jgi:enamine deaminase RidA (YjgF/YER057c/UK114 family)
VTVSGTGKIVYIAGQLVRDIDGNCVGKGDMRAQMEQTFENLDQCLKAAGATFDKPARQPLDMASVSRSRAQQAM